MMNNLFMIHFKYRSFVFIIIDLDLILLDISNLFIAHFEYHILIKMDRPLVEDLALGEVSFHLIFVFIIFNSIALKNIVIFVNFLIILYLLLAFISCQRYFFKVKSLQLEVYFLN